MHFLSFIHRRLRLLAADSQGVALVEFALTLPFLLAMFMGTVEYSRYILINQKLDKTVNTVGDVVAQSEEVTTGEIDVLFGAVQHIMEPYSFNSNGRIIITSVSQTNGTPKVKWQYAGGGTMTHNSSVGAVNATAALPGGMTLYDGEDIIVAEIYYNFTPMMVQDMLGTKSISKIAVFKPRLGALSTLKQS